MSSRIVTNVLLVLLLLVMGGIFFILLRNNTNLKNNENTEITNSAGVDEEDPVSFIEYNGVSFGVIHDAIITTLKEFPGKYTVSTSMDDQDTEYAYILDPETDTFNFTDESLYMHVGEMVFRKNIVNIFKNRKTGASYYQVTNDSGKVFIAEVLYPYRPTPKYIDLRSVAFR
jgi:hypothetical protein